MINYKDEITEDFTEDPQTILLQLIEHIELKTEGSMSDYIIDFCEEHSYRIEDVAELIKDNKNIKNLLKQDCIYHGILTNPKKIKCQRIEDW